VKYDELDTAFSALRDETSGPAPGAQATLARVLATSRGASRRRLRLAKLWLPIAAVLVASSAWAAQSGRFGSMFASDPPAGPPSGSPLTLQGSALSTSAAAASTPVEAPASAATTTPVASASEAPLITSSAAPLPPIAAAAQRQATAPRPDKAENKEQGGLAEDKAAFEAAYRVHGQMSPAAPSSGAGPRSANAAVAAWNQYLSRQPNGRFVPEARYARAVALARAGSRAEAQQALEVFAEGEPGSYRQDDAKALMKALESSEGPQR